MANQLGFSPTLILVKVERKERMSLLWPQEAKSEANKVFLAFLGKQFFDTTRIQKAKRFFCATITKPKQWWWTERVFFCYDFSFNCERRKRELLSQTPKRCRSGCKTKMPRSCRKHIKIFFYFSSCSWALPEGKKSARHKIKETEQCSPRSQSTRSHLHDESLCFDIFSPRKNKKNLKTFSTATS
jgi:hypothetical protein